ncbi:hypothetical protein HNY73_008479 [Argiope bruennichi]|uniref:Uncharacterized protein n=1 Tax=Argiope bruennichi TaxID=94029 RepID=A0A8T0F6M5_ARGBR|nr:hypothetical protein HNY73_008479 [Argiope bruennichi]
MNPPRPCIPPTSPQAHHKASIAPPHHPLPRKYATANTDTRRHLFPHPLRDTRSHARTTRISSALTCPPHHAPPAPGYLKTVRPHLCTRHNYSPPPSFTQNSPRRTARPTGCGLRWATVATASSNRRDDKGPSAQLPHQGGRVTAPLSRFPSAPPGTAYVPSAHPLADFNWSAVCLMETQTKACTSTHSSVRAYTTATSRSSPYTNQASPHRMYPRAYQLNSYQESKQPPTPQQCPQRGILTATCTQPRTLRRFVTLTPRRDQHPGHTHLDTQAVLPPKGSSRPGQPREARLRSPSPRREFPSPRGRPTLYRPRPVRAQGATPYSSEPPPRPTDIPLGTGTTNLSHSHRREVTPPAPGPRRFDTPPRPPTVPLTVRPHLRNPETPTCAENQRVVRLWAQNRAAPASSRARGRRKAPRRPTHSVTSPVLVLPAEDTPHKNHGRRIREIPTRNGP